MGTPSPRLVLPLRFPDAAVDAGHGKFRHGEAATRIPEAVLVVDCAAVQPETD